MGAMHQLANASLAAIFTIGMIIASHQFTSSRATRAPSHPHFVNVVMTRP